MDLNKAQELSWSLMKEHGLDKWVFKFDNAKNRFGCCSYRRKTISLSKDLVLLNSKERVKNTILHEIAHALTPGHHHDEVWRKKAIEIGCNGERCFTKKDTVMVKGKYLAKCKNCDKTFERFRKPTKSYSCSYCSGGKYNPNFKLTYDLNLK